MQRRRPLARWPWAVGILVLALAIWGLSRLLAHDEGDEVVEQMRHAESAPNP